MKRICLIACLLMGSHVGWATEKSLTVGFGASTDYLWRGITFSNHKPIVKGGMDFAMGGFNVGNWVSTSQGYGSSDLIFPNDDKGLVKDEKGLKSDGNGLENALYAKYSLAITNNWSIHLGGIYFYYPHNISARYGRVYLGGKWQDASGKNHVTLEVGTWDYAAESGPAESESLDYRLMATAGIFNFKVIWEEDHFATGSDYQYYQIQTSIGTPKTWELPEDFCLGVTLGYSNYGVPENLGWTNYFHWMLSLNRKFNGFETSLFYSDTDRTTTDPETNLPGDTDHTFGLSFLKTF